MRVVDVLSSRRGFAVALVLLMAVAGYLHGVVISAGLGAPAGFTLCHGAAGGTPSGDAINHSCCDDCVLSAAATAPAPPILSLPVEIVIAVASNEARSTAPAGVRLVTPRQSQGPPAA